ncbi:hypothetical protein PF004_g18086 [Phytophthora fragariae]|uniref:Uncharacterized protein n=1 Tax=Phytophthora fragariae TaxID=53985 RepID=A0A6G0NDK5_9STRA|nr:hypothetical protein PF004_g18086 [Phytophthora fragariae]
MPPKLLARTIIPALHYDTSTILNVGQFDVQSLAEIVRPEQACLLGPGTIEKKVKIALPSRQCRRLGMAARHLRSAESAAVRAEEGAGPEPTAVAFDVEEVARIIVNNV